MTSTSTPKDVQLNTSLQSKQKSTIKPDRPLTSNLFGYQNNTPEDDIYISDTEDKEFIQMFDFQHSYLTQEEFEKVIRIILTYKQVYATTKFDVGKTKVKLNLPMKKDAIFKKQRISKVPIHL